MTEREKNLQDNLSLIRMCAGWSTSYLGEKLGVSRQMVNIIEKGKTRITRMQYLAIRYVLDEEIQEFKDDYKAQILRDILRVLVDETDKYSEEDKEKVRQEAGILLSRNVLENASKKGSNATKTLLAGAAALFTTAGATTLMGPAGILAAGVGKTFLTAMTAGAAGAAGTVAAQRVMSSEKIPADGKPKEENGKEAKETEVENRRECE